MAESEPVFTRRLQLGLGLLAGGLGLLFLAAKALPAPVPSGIAAGVALAVAGLVVVVVEALREPPAGSGPSAGDAAEPGRSRSGPDP